MDHKDGEGDGDGDGAGLGSGVDGDSGEGMAKNSGGDSGGSLLSLCFWFCVSLPPPSGKRRGTFYIGIFRSQGCFRAKDRCKWGHEGQKRWAHAAPVPSCVGAPPFAPPAPVRLLLSLLGLPLSKIMIPVNL